MPQDRPDPETLLVNAKEDELARRRGKLKVYLGMAAGVGKTYAMLSDALAEIHRGVDVVAGYIEPHGRIQTENLVLNMEKLPLREIEISGVIQKEFDLDAAIKRKPSLLLVDELAHSNAPGSRHAKRWQDINELLEAGISVFTTVNIQHLESLKDTVAQITGIFVHETVPDVFIQKADEIELVDIPPSELIVRLKEGKVYPKERIDTALKNFFKEGNLLALRELVLRHSVKSVDAQIQRFRRRNAVEEIWATTQRLMVLVGPSPMAESLVRKARNLAHSMGAEILAVSFDTTAAAALPPEQREYASDALQLAESLGCETMIVPTEDMVSETLRVARERNVSSIVLGRSVRSRWYHLMKPQFSDELIQRGGDLSFHILNADSGKLPASKFPVTKEIATWINYLKASLAILLSTILAAAMFRSFELSNLIMVYLVGVTWVASRYSYKESAFAAILAVGLFDFLFVPPHFTFAVSDIQYLVTFAVMMGVSFIITGLAQRLKVQSKNANERERRTAALFALARGLLSANSRSEIGRIACEEMHRALGLEVDILFVEKDVGSLKGRLPLEAQEQAVAIWVYNNNLSAGCGTSTLPGANSLYLPLGSNNRCQAVLRVIMLTETECTFERMKLISAYAAQISLGLERISSQEDSEASKQKAEIDMVRNTLLSSVSHDLRTPLSIITGSAHSLLENGSINQSEKIELLQQIETESERLSRIVNNVLELTKLESGNFKPRVDWCSVEELVGGSLDHARLMLQPREVITKIDRDLPLVRVDPVLFDQVLVNIFENISRHTPASSKVEVVATTSASNDEILIEISDNGPGLQAGMEERIFDKLYSGPKSKGGIGLGLTVARMIVQLHDGQISAHNRASGGAVFRVILPACRVKLEAI